MVFPSEPSSFSLRQYHASTWSVKHLSTQNVEGACWECDSFCCMLGWLLIKWSVPTWHTEWNRMSDNQKSDNWDTAILICQAVTSVLACFFFFMLTYCPTFYFKWQWSIMVYQFSLWLSATNIKVWWTLITDLSSEWSVCLWIVTFCINGHK
jgi:hypothetical protein